MNFKKIKIIIIAGGKGSRLLPISEQIPKPMVRVSGKPVLEHILEMFKFYGFREFIFSVGYKKDFIIKHFGSGKQFGVKINYVYEDENNLLGDAAGVALSKELLDQTFIVTFGDILRSFDIPLMFKFHNLNQGLGTVNLYKKALETAISIVRFNADGLITSFLEKPDKSLIKDKYIFESSSFFILEPELLSFFSSERVSDFGFNILPKMISAGIKLKAYVTDDYLIDIGTAARLNQAELDIKSGKFKPY